jgi:hypothetical protein
MRARAVFAIAGAALLAMGHARTAHAQAQPDTAGLAEAVASTLVSGLASARYTHRLEVDAGSTAFDSAVAGRLRTLPAAGLPEGPAGDRSWVGVHGATLQGDTAAVLVRFGSSVPPDGRLITTYIETQRYFFVREPSGWRFLRRDFVSGADIGPVRG